MNNGEIIITAGALSSAVLEAFKFLYRKFVLKDMNYDFPVWFYTVSLAVLNALAPFALVFLGVATDDPILTLDAMGVVRYVVLILVSSLVSLVTHTAGIKPLRTYSRRQAFQNSRLTPQ